MSPRHSSISIASPTPAILPTSHPLPTTRATPSSTATSAIAELVARLCREHQPAAIVHFAAESHVDRSILGPEEFVRTNVHGTFTLLEEARSYFGALPPRTSRASASSTSPPTKFTARSAENDPAFSETTPYAPNSPYAASKAASDHLVRAWFHTYGLPTLTTNCSNNYGPFQFPEKLIPLMILNALRGKPLPVYGDGQNVRDWLYVGDHCAAIRCVLAQRPSRRNLQRRRPQRASQHRRRPNHLRPAR